jgi:hypothetical protein
MLRFESIRFCGVELGRVKRQKMQSTQRGAHLLLQIWIRVLNEDWEDTFRG